MVDPRRDIEEYLTDAEANGLTIVGVLNTHFHADFVSGHIELAEATGAWIGYGKAAETDFASRKLGDGDRIELGGPDGVVLEIMETPGHTPESISVLVRENAGDATPYGVLTGDALFIGDVGRPDLLASIGVTADELGKMLYDSVQHKLMGLPDETRVFPAHGAGSACGKNLSTEKSSTIGEQRRFNYACQPMSEEQFLAVVTAGQPTAPEYFVYNAILNRRERDKREVGAALRALSPEEIDKAVAEGAKIVDARDPVEFAAGHVRGSINVPVNGRMAETVGMVVKPEDTIVLVAPEGEEQEAGVRFSRIGFDKVVGFVPRPEAYLIDHQDRVERASRLNPLQLDAAVAGGRRAADRHPQRRRDRGRHDPGGGQHPAGRAHPPGGGARPGHADGALLRRRLALQRGRQPAAEPRLLRRLRRARRLRRLGRHPRRHRLTPRRVGGS